ncbi:MAG: Hsp33 family molecular chaperone HslO, partial [Butyrivibrio sp.]
MEDYMIRATAAGGQIRAFAACTKETTETARKAHNTSPVVTAALGRLLTAAAMMGSMMKGDEDVITLKVEGNGPIKSLLVTADSKGHVKGYPSVPRIPLLVNSKGKLDVAGGIGVGLLTVIKDIGLKEPYSGTCELITSEIAEDITYYFASSE